ncbi:MAG: hypothetical protein DCC58_10465 [Chloroflexi bacterium]|nr:MAG: hypothetical protein DCC58_10465 [Chloroflexota bacterium]
MTSNRCRFPQEWLVALHDDDLRAAQLEITEAHLRACPECRQWLDEMDAIARLLRENTPYPDNPAARAEIKARVATDHTNVHTHNWSTTRRALAVMLAVLLLMAVGVGFWREPAIEAGTGLARYMRGASTATPPALGASTPGEPITVPEATIAAPTLPLGLAETGEHEVADTFVRRAFRAQSGLAISYVVDCSANSYVAPAERAGMSEVVGLDGLPVYVFYGQSHGQVVALYWVQAGTLHEVLVLEEAVRPVSLDNALLLVEAFVAEAVGSPVACGG